MSLGSWLNERQKTRQENKTARVQARTAARSVAYSNGINPYGVISDSIGHITTGAASVANSLSAVGIANAYGTAASTTLNSLPGQKTASGYVSADSTIWWIAGAALLFALLFKR